MFKLKYIVFQKVLSGLFETTYKISKVKLINDKLTTISTKTNNKHRLHSDKI